MLFFSWLGTTRADTGSSGGTAPCSLDRAPGRRHAEVVRVEGGREVSRRLAQLGVHRGTVLYVKQSAPLGGPILIETRGTTVAVGRGLARKILVRPLP